MRVRSHTVPTITTVDHEPMTRALRQQFDVLLENAESAANWRLPAVKRRGSLLSLIHTDPRHENETKQKTPSSH